LSAFILTMVLNPEVLHEAQVEIDEVVSKERLPDFNDREKSLPYLECIIREVYQYSPPFPLGKFNMIRVEISTDVISGLIYHLISNDQYHGYHILQRTVAAPNMWSVPALYGTHNCHVHDKTNRAMSHNPQWYPNPEVFCLE
ncbi:hypothetical protein WOLCODRAFT_66883, partial [Wolfiporia cocos MD-104 SS10]